jgi:predicted unusual protein kinase regulating ubiquinone biosynthesis (AarF/ABC1/UbiB family)
VLEREGPAAIKMGQFLSTRADIFGTAFAEDLSHLKDRLPAFPLEVAKAEIERGLGRPLDTSTPASRPRSPRPPWPRPIRPPCWTGRGWR